MHSLEELLENAKVVENARKWLSEHPGKVVCVDPEHCMEHKPCKKTKKVKVSSRDA